MLCLKFSGCMMRFVIDPSSLSIGMYRIGMNKTEVWSQTRSPIISFYPQNSSVRSDDIQLEGVFLHYDDITELVQRVVVFTRLNNKVNNYIELFGEILNFMNRADIRTLLELEGKEFTSNEEKIVCASLHLSFGFRDDEEDIDEQKLDYVYFDLHDTW